MCRRAICAIGLFAFVFMVPGITLMILLALYPSSNALTYLAFIYIGTICGWLGSKTVDLCVADNEPEQQPILAFQ